MPLLTDLQVTFRCLRDKKLEFTEPGEEVPAPFVALVGGNGSGKTAVLDAIALTIGNHMAHQGMISAAGFLRSGWHINLSFTSGGLSARPGHGISITPGALHQELRRALYVPSGYLPDMPRRVSLSAGPKSGIPVEQAMALSMSNRVRALHQWWLHQHWEYPRTSNLERLWTVLEPFLGDVTYAGVNPEDHLPLFHARGSYISFNELSSGERRLILLFMEVVMQCGTDGLLLLDDPETHFHPEWQRKLRPALQSVLPKGQIVVATRSEFILEDLLPHQQIALDSAS